MSVRKRLTARMDDSAIAAELDKLEHLVNAGADEDLVNEAQALADEEVDIVKDETDESVSENVEQNERAQDNWPMNASEREVLAGRLVTIAKRLMGKKE